MNTSKISKPERNMKIQIPSIFFFFFFFLLSTTVLTQPTAGVPFPPISNDTDFIRTSCSTTLYPKTCFTSLSGYSSAVQQDPRRLARVAINVTLSNVKNMSRYVTNISRHIDSGSSPRVAAAVHDCHELFRDAIDDIRQSLRQMRRLNGSGEDLRFQLSNVQTWMSSALTNEETCTDGFEEAPDCGVKTEVCDRAVNVKEVTSIALALVNRFADTIRMQTP